MPKLLMKVEGVDGQVGLTADRVMIRRDGIFNIVKYGLNSQREIPIAAIAEIVFRDAGALMFGQIEFVRAGRSADERKKDYSAVKFNKKQQPQFAALKEKIFDLINQHHHHKQ